MKLKRALIAFAAAFLLSAALSIWYHAPVRFLSSVDSEDIAVIHVGSGHSGNRFDIDDPEAIAYFTESIRQHSFRRSGISISYVGFWYTLSFCDSQGEVITGFTVNSDTAVQDDPFFYHTDSSLNITDYLQTLENQAIS